MRKGVAVVICPNDLLTQKLKTQLTERLIQLNQNLYHQNSRASKSHEINR